MANILIVEDSKTMASAEAYALWNAQHTVQFAESGKDALHLVGVTDFDLILLDYELPDTNGLLVFRAIRKKDPDALVIMITGRGDEELAAQVLKEGAKDYLIKSNTLLEILPRAVETVLKDEQNRLELVEKDDALRRANEFLETRVAERTRELAEANEKLKVEIAERKEMGKALRDSNRMMLSVLESINDGFFSLDDAMVLGYCNGAAERLLNRKKEDLLNRNLFEAFPEFRGTLFEKKFTEAIVTGKPLAFELNFEVEPYRNWYDVRVFPRKGGITVHFQVTTGRKLTEQRLEKLAHYDVLTHLPNRALFMDRLTQAVERAKRFGQLVAVMLIDLDRFKEINDTLGHRAGDRLLKEVGKRFENCVRKVDTVSRLGGDEFTIVLPDIKRADRAAMVARRLLRVFQEPFRLEGHEVFVTASMGVTVYPMDTDQVDHMLKNADTAMYHAKSKGKNDFSFFAPSMNTNALEKFMIESDLRRALTNEEFLLYYQPKVNSDTGRLMGVEALVRWEHPEKGMVGPNKFIPIAEDTGLIIALGEWVLRQACLQSVARVAAGFEPLPVSVNVSTRQFHKKEFSQTVASVLGETGMDPGFLEIEITETVLIQEVEETIKILNTLKEMGVSLSVDDFGTGYSSLNYLKRFPLDVLKIDRSFVNDITTHPDDRAVVESIIALGHNLNLKVIAEGVETKEQFLLLKEKKCDGVQGYYFSKPVPEAELRALIESGTAFLP